MSLTFFLILPQQYGIKYATYNRKYRNNSRSDDYMSTYRVAIIPGDGVGNEVASEATKILKVVADKYGFNIKTDDFDWGCDYYIKNGVMMPANALEILREFDAIFLGCIGDANKVPDHISLTLLLAIRKGFDQYINLRPSLHLH